MTEMFQQLLDWVALHPYWSGAIIFLTSMAESLAIVGLVVPGVAIMFGIGAMIGAGSIEFGTAMAWSVAGAIVGDGLSFWLGWHFKERLKDTWPFTRYPGSLNQGVDFFQKYGGKSVAIGRFFGPVRAVIPLVAGMMRMPPIRFVVANVLSALAWAPTFLLPGMLFGTSMKLASEVAFRLVIVILLLVSAIWFVVWLVHRLFLLLQPRATHLLQAFLSWGYRHPMVEGIAGALADPQHPEAKGLSILASLLLIGATLFTLITGWSLNEGSEAGINYTVLETLQSLRTPWADHLMVFITGFGDWESMLLFFVVVLGYLLWSKRKRAALYWLAAAGFALLAGPLLKYGLQVPRPDIVGHAKTSYAFPSGHTLWAMVLYGFFAVLVARTLTARWRWIPYGLAGLLITSVALSRLYLGMHWLSDVLGSIALGLIWVSALGIAYNRHASLPAQSRLFAISGVTALLLGLTIHTLYTHDMKFSYYTPKRSIVDMPEAYWWTDGWQELPQERLDTRKQLEHKLSLQYAGSLESFTTALQKAGWSISAPLTWKKMINLLSPSLPLKDLPLFPQVHDGSHEALSMEKILPDERRLVLRFWPAYLKLSPGSEDLWLGLVVEQHKAKLLELAVFAANSKSQEGAFQQFATDSAGFFDRRVTENGVMLLRRKGRTPP